MGISEVNENCRYAQNDPHRCKMKLEKFHFDILCCYGVIKGSLLGGRNSPPPPPGCDRVKPCQNWLTLHGKHYYLFLNH